MRGTDVNKNNTKGDMTMWLGAFVETCQENVSLSEMKSGITMFQKVCLKMKIQTLVHGTLVWEQIMEMSRGGSMNLNIDRKRKAVKT